MRAWHCAGLVLLVGCGRIEFDPLVGAEDAFACPGNLAPSADFEGGSGGWLPDADSIMTREQEPGRGFVAQVCRNNMQPEPEDYEVEDSPALIVTPRPGDAYRLSILARKLGATQQIGGPQLTLRDVAEPERAYIPEVLAEDWARLAIEHVVVQDGGTKLSVSFEVLEATFGTCFQVDDICLQRLEPR